MKKIFFYILLPLTFFSLIECNSKETKKTENKGCDSWLIGRPTNEVSLPIYKIDSCFNKYLDTIIEEETKCTFFDSCQSGFLYYMRNYIFVSDTTERVSPRDLIMISSENIYTYDYTYCLGIFEYKGYRFICDSLCNKDFLKKTNKLKKIKYLKIDKKRIPEIDDRWSDWTFNVKNKKIKIYSHHPCYIGKERYPKMTE